MSGDKSNDETVVMLLHNGKLRVFSLTNQIDDIPQSIESLVSAVVKVLENQGVELKQFEHTLTDSTSQGVICLPATGLTREAFPIDKDSLPGRGWFQSAEDVIEDF